jgi:sugar (pentulose or hexulose) kinase
VHAGIHDSNASYLTHRLRYSKENRFSVVSTGTWILCMSSSGSLEALEEQKDTLANVDAFGAPVACSRFMGGREFEILAGADGTKIAVEQADIEALLARSALALPCFASSGGPFRERPGRIVGLEDDGVRSRAALATLYSALMTDYCLDLVGVDGDCIIEGSFTQNRAYCSLLAALRPSQRVLVSTDTTGTVRGTALLSNLSSEGSPKAENPFEPVAPLVIEALGQYRRRWRAAAEGA